MEDSLKPAPYNPQHAGGTNRLNFFVEAPKRCN